MITSEVAKNYLEEILEIPSNWKDILQRDKVEFLRLYMHHHATRIPFQNITLAAVETEKRCRPDESTIIEQGLSGKGGCCINLNYFTKIVLEAIGLDAYAIIGTHFSAPIASTHCMVVVKIGNDEHYLVEVGGALPILDPVPMHRLPFRIISAGGFPYEFRKISDGVVGRFHMQGGLFGGEYIDKSEALRTLWDMTPRKFSEFDFSMNEVFTNPKTSTLLRTPLMCRYFFKEEFRKLFPELKRTSNEEICSRNGQQYAGTPTDFVFIYKRTIVIGDAVSRKLVTNYDSYDNMMGDVQKYFPTLENAELVKAFKNFECYEVIRTPYDNIL